MKDFEGTYLGFSPTDESAVVLGELEVVIDSQNLKSRMATGLEIQEEEIPLSEFKPMSTEEVAGEFNPDSTSGSLFTGFRVGETGARFLFLIENTDDPGLIIRGGLGDILGPTILYNPRQVAEGLFEKAVENIEVSYGQYGVLPRLSNNGRSITAT